MYNWFGHVANASENLRARIFEMNRRDLTPLEYRQQIQSHPGMMLVTALNKQRYTRQISLSFSAELVQLTCFDLSEKGRLSQIRNIGYLNELMQTLKSENNYKDRKTRGMDTARVFSKVRAQVIIDFLTKFEHTREIGIWNSQLLVRYIMSMVSKNELIEWSVAFHTSSRPEKGSKLKKIDDWKVNSTVRSGEMDTRDIFSFNNRSLTSPSHEKFDFDRVSGGSSKNKWKLEEHEIPRMLY